MANPTEPSPMLNDIYDLYVRVGYRLGEFVSWAKTKNLSTVFGKFYSVDVDAFLAEKTVEIPNKFDGKIAAIKCLREMVSKKCDGLYECKNFVEAVGRSAADWDKPRTW